MRIKASYSIRFPFSWHVIIGKIQLPILTSKGVTQEWYDIIVTHEFQMILRNADSTYTFNPDTPTVIGQGIVEFHFVDHKRYVEISITNEGSL